MSAVQPLPNHTNRKSSIEFVEMDKSQSIIMKYDAVIPQNIRNYIRSSQTTQPEAQPKKKKPVRNRRRMRIGQALEVREFD